MGEGRGGGGAAQEAPGDSGGAGGAKVWFAARATPCERVVGALAALAGQPGVVTPSAVRVAETGTWCAVAVAGGRRGARADSWAQNASSLLGAPAVAFYVADGAWSYAVFDAGQPVGALESHYGEPVVVGDVTRAAATLGVPAEALADARLSARRPDAHLELAARVGFGYPPEAAPWVTVQGAGAPARSEEGPDGGPRFAVGTWVAMPPLGVMLIKAVEAQGPAEAGAALTLSYVVVAGPRQLTVPVAGARRLGMRPLATAAQAEEVLASLRESVSVHAPREYLEGRAWRWLEALKRGDLAAIALAHRELCAIRRVRALYGIEGGLLDSAQAWLTDELATATGARPDEIRAALSRACD